MGDFFLKISMISIYASIIIFVVIVLRKIFKNAPKNIFLLFWVVVALRLLFPISIDNVFSLIPEPTQTVESVVSLTQNTDEEATNSDTDESITTVSSVNDKTEEESSLFFNDFSIVDYISFIWITGILIGLIYSFIVYIKFKKRLKFSVRMEGYYLCDMLEQPCVVGIIHPKIYVPSDIQKGFLPYILAHERSHIYRKDFIMKIVWYIIRIIYWFNPIVWLAYYLLSSDIEQACDETTIKKFDIKEKMEYANIILSCSVKNDIKSGLVLGLGNGELKNRIKNLKKKSAIKKKYIVLGICACIIVAVIFGIGYQPENENNIIDEESTSDISDDTESEDDFDTLFQGVERITTYFSEPHDWISDSDLQQHYDLDLDGIDENIVLTDLGYNGGDGGYSFGIYSEDGTELYYAEEYDIYVKFNDNGAKIYFGDNVIETLSMEQLEALYEEEDFLSEFEEDYESGTIAYGDAISGAYYDEENNEYITKTYLSGFLGHYDCLGYVLVNIGINEDGEFSVVSYSYCIDK